MKGVIKGLVKAGEQLICVRDSSQLMPDYNTFGFAYISPVMYEKNNRQRLLSADKRCFINV